jgi:hypothetical protein
MIGKRVVKGSLPTVRELDHRDPFYLSVVSRAERRLTSSIYGKSRTMHAAASDVRANRTITGYRRFFSWHASTGIRLLAGALFLAVSGITWSPRICCRGWRTSPIGSCWGSDFPNIPYSCAHQLEALKRLRDMKPHLETAPAGMTEAFALYDVLVGVILLFAAIMAAALLYNAMWVNVAERSVELRTLRAAGMSPGLLGRLVAARGGSWRLVAAENLTLAILGLPLGLGIGALLANWLMSTYEFEGYRLSLVMQPTTPLLVSAGVLVAALLAQIPALRTIRLTDAAMARTLAVTARARSSLRGRVPVRGRVRLLRGRCSPSSVLAATLSVNVG